DRISHPRSIQHGCSSARCQQARRRSRRARPCTSSPYGTRLQSQRCRPRLRIRVIPHPTPADRHSSPAHTLDVPPVPECRGRCLYFPLHPPCASHAVRIYNPTAPCRLHSPHVPQNAQERTTSSRSRLCLTPPLLPYHSHLIIHIFLCCRRHALFLPPPSTLQTRPGTL
ncbi:hypothetical protein C8J57DRAFT_1716973, partial [Mycena rebaudengoi]